MAYQKRIFCGIFWCLLISFSLWGGQLSLAWGAPVSLQGGSLKILKDGEYFPVLRETLDKAKREITLSYFHFKTRGEGGSYPDVILRSLIAAAQRGVKVVVLLERGKDAGDDTTLNNRRTQALLQKMGVSVYLDAPERTTHTKMTVIDGRYTFVGSHNLTQSGLKHNHEISVLIESPQVAAEALEYIKSLIKNEAAP